jgi:voltage-gated potassium channel
MVTATLASWLIDRVREVEEAAEIVTRQQVAEISQEIAELRAELRAIHETVRGPALR